MKNSYANEPLSLHPTTSSVLLPSTPSTTVLGLQSLDSRPKQVVGRRKPAFTIVELLIVIVVIGILAAISVVAYNGVVNSASNATVKADLRNAMNKIALYAESSGIPAPGQLTSALQGFSVSTGAYAQRNNFMYCANTDESLYGIGAVSKSGKSYVYSSNGGLKELGSTLSETSGGATGACYAIMGALPTAGSWGYSMGIWNPWTQ